MEETEETQTALSQPLMEAAVVVPARQEAVEALTQSLGEMGQLVPLLLLGLAEMAETDAFAVIRELALVVLPHRQRIKM